MLIRLTLSVALLLTGIAFQVGPVQAEDNKPVKAKHAAKAKKQIASKPETTESSDTKAGADGFVPYAGDSTFIIGQ